MLVPGGAQITLSSIDAKGNTLPYSPDLTYNIGVDSQAPFGDRTAFVQRDGFVQRLVLLRIRQSARAEGVPLPECLDQLGILDSHLGLRVFINNMLDKAVSSQFGSLVTGYEADYPQAPRTYGFQARYSF